MTSQRLSYLGDHMTTRLLLTSWNHKTPCKKKWSVTTGHFWTPSIAHKVIVWSWVLWKKSSVETKGLFTSKHLLDSNIFRNVQWHVFDGIKADEGVPFHAGALCQAHPTRKTREQKTRVFLQKVEHHSPYTEPKLEFWAKTRVFRLQKSTTWQTRNVRLSTFAIKKTRVLKFQKCHSVCSLHATTCVCFMLCVLTSWALWTQHTLFGSCGRSVCFLFLQFVAPILIFVVECDSRRLRS